MMVYFCYHRLYYSIETIILLSSVDIMDGKDNFFKFSSFVLKTNCKKNNCFPCKISFQLILFLIILQEHFVYE